MAKFTKIFDSKIPDSQELTEIEIVALEVFSMTGVDPAGNVCSLPRSVGVGSDGRKWAVCEGRCKKCSPEVQPRASCTAYHTEAEVESYDDPNRSIWLCEECNEEYQAHMDDLWGEYYASQGRF